jgi:hypothetical protein
MLRQFNDVEAAAPKYNLNEEEYDKREDTFRSIKRQGKIQVKCEKDDATPELDEDDLKKQFPIG